MSAGQEAESLEHPGLLHTSCTLLNREAAKRGIPAALHASCGEWNINSEGGGARTHDLGIKRTLTPGEPRPRPRGLTPGWPAMPRGTTRSLVHLVVQSHLVDLPGHKHQPWSRRVLAGRGA